MSRSSFFAESEGPGQSDLSLMDWYLAEMLRIYNLALGLYADMEVLRDQTVDSAAEAAASAIAASSSSSLSQSFAEQSEDFYNLMLGLSIGGGGFVNDTVYLGTLGAPATVHTITAGAHKRMLVGIRGTGVDGGFYLPDALLTDLVEGEYIVLFNATESAAPVTITYQTGGNLVSPSVNALEQYQCAMVLRANVGNVLRLLLLKFEGPQPTQTLPLESIIIAASDETTALTTGSSKVTFRMPYALALTSVRLSLSTAQSSGSILTVDVNMDGASLFTTRPTIDNGEKTTITATTQCVFDPITLGIDGEITVDIDQLGDGTAKGLKVMLIGTKPA